MSTIEILSESDDPDKRPVRHVREADPDDPSAQEQSPPPTAVIWAVRAVAVSAMLSILAFLGYLIMSDTVPAQFVIEPDYEALSQRGDSYVLPVRVINDSTEAVTAVVLDAVLDIGTIEPEELSLTFPLMGEGETATAELRFTQEPTPDTLELRVTSYQSP